MANHWLTIIGGGLAGLSLCDEVIQIFAVSGKPLPGKIRVLEQREQFQNDKTYGFFSRQPPTGIPHQHYSAWRFSCASTAIASNKSSEIEQVGTHFFYYRVNSLDVMNGLIQRLQANINVEIVMGVDATSMPIDSPLVVDTRPCAMQDMYIKQSFIGVEVGLSHPINPNVAHLMSNMRMINGRFTFDYILPLNERRALVEVTQFAKEPAPMAELEQLLQACLAQLGSDGSSTRTERAVIPMGLTRSFSEKLASQQVRTATGYGYLETKRWAKRNACAIFNGKPVQYDNQSALLKWFDKRLLKVVDKQPERLPEVFMQMAGNLTADTFAEFISSPTISSCLHVMTAVPKRTFIRTLYA